ncbi:MAG: ABC transporter ATP-binding protein [Chloroflexi bacterium]|nr:ABC transporter ATP-binding protein [Chloroflexota bacterium]
MIQFENVSKRYRIGVGHGSLRESVAELPRRLLRRNGQHQDDNILWALRDVSFDVKPGEALGVIGPNGAGKTTILKMLSGITKPTSGKLNVVGRIGALIELGAGFHPDLTGRENIYLNATILGMRRREVDKLFDDIVEFAGLRRFIDTPVKRYSSGMYARLGFAVAAHVRADVLLVDEVLSVGDTGFQARCVERMKCLQSEGAAIVFVSHNLMAVGGMCQKGLLMSQGCVQVYGPVDEAIRAYADVMHAASQASMKQTRGETAGSTGYGVEISKVSLMGGDGAERDTFLMGDSLTVRISYDAKQRIARPVFAIGIVRSDGLNCCSSTTKMSGMDIPWIEGQGTVEVVLDKIRLIPGVYQMGVLVWDYEMIQPYVFIMTQVFTVESHEVNIDHNYGVFVPDLTWRQVE